MSGFSPITQTLFDHIIPQIAERTLCMSIAKKLSFATGFSIILAIIGHYNSGLHDFIFITLVSSTFTMCFNSAKELWNMNTYIKRIAARQLFFLSIAISLGFLSQGVVSSGLALVAALVSLIFMIIYNTIVS